MLQFVPMYSFGVHTLRRHLRERNALALAQRAALLKEQEKIVEQHIRNINNTIGKAEGWSDNDEIRVRAEDVVLPASIKTLRQYTVYVASDSVHVRAILKSLCEYVDILEVMYLQMISCYRRFKFVLRLRNLTLLGISFPSVFSPHSLYLHHIFPTSVVSLSLCRKDPDCLQIQFMPSTPLHIIKSTYVVTFVFLFGGHIALCACIKLVSLVMH